MSSVPSPGPGQEHEPERQCTWQRDGQRCVRQLNHRWAHMDAGAADVCGAYRADKVGQLRRERSELMAERAKAGYRDQAPAEPLDGTS